jgi:hypothetical protein
LRYFQDEMEQRGWQAVVAEHLFAEDNVRSRDLLGRLFAGLLHPLIQLMFGLEWAQPAIIAEGLAQAAVHKDNVVEFFDRAERRAAEREASSTPRETAPLIQLIQEVGRSRRNKGDHEKLARSPLWGDASQVQDGVFARALDEAVEVASRIRVREEDLEERTAEMLHTAAHVAAATAWHPPHVPKFDFFIM